MGHLSKNIARSCRGRRTHQHQSRGGSIYRTAGGGAAAGEIDAYQTGEIILLPTGTGSPSSSVVPRHRWPMPALRRCGVRRQCRGVDAAIPL